MSFSISSLVRLIVMLALGSSILAIGLSKLDPPRPTWRTRHLTRYHNLNEYFLNSTDRTARWLDAETAQVSTIPLEEGDVLDAASCAPWVDDKGLRQVVGRWSRRTRMGPMSISTDFGLARYSFPTGGLLDHVSTEIVPVGPPCWFPGVRARILFAAGDGQLYHFAFEGDPHAKEKDQDSRTDVKPNLLKWRCPRPGLGKVFLSDLTWPEDPRLSGYVLVSLREQSPDCDAIRTFTRATLWWLKLNNAGTEIVECGKLLKRSNGTQHFESIDQRCPSVGTIKKGQPILSYFTENPKKQGWNLVVTPIEFEGDHHVPRADESNALTLATDCQPAHASFSADGRWINAIAESHDLSSRILRLSLAKLSPPSR